MLAWPSHSCTLAMSAWWSSALVAAVARSAWAPISKPSCRRISPHQLVDPVGRQRLVEAAGAVVADRPEQRAVLVLAVPGGVEVIVDQRVGAGMQRQIPRLLALAGDLQMRHAPPRVSEILDLQLAQLLAPQRVKQQGRQDGAVALLLDGFLPGGALPGAASSSRAWWSPSAGVLPSPLSALGRLTPLTGLWVTAFFSQRYSNSDDSAARRWRIVAAAERRARARSSRQAMTCARVTVRNSSGRTMPVKRMKSPIAFS